MHQVIDLDEIQRKIEARQGESEQRSQPPVRRALDRALVETVWQLMGSLYGHRWVSSYGADVDPDNVWSATLYGITEAQIRAGMRRCVDLALDWPPAAPEFRKMCLGVSDAWEHQTEAYKAFAPDRSLPDLSTAERRHEVGKKHLAELMASFGCTKRVTQ